MSPLPAPGEVYAAPVAPGVELLFRILGEHREVRCLVATRHAGAPRSSVPRAATVRELQPHDHHQWDRPMIGGWVPGPAPAPFRLLGRLPLTPAEEARVIHPQLYLKVPAPQRRRLHDAVLPERSWQGVLDDAVAQWRWDHQRAQVLAEDAARAVLQQSALHAALEARGRELVELQERGVKALRARRFFAAWKGSHPPALIREAEALIKDALATLEGKSPRQAARSLVALVKRFNALDGRHGHDLDTTDAEDIMDAVGTLALACRVDEQTFDTVIDAVREF